MTPTNPTDAQMKLADVTDADVTAALPTESELKLARKCTARANFLLEEKTLQSILNGEEDTWPEVVASILAIRATEARAQGLAEAIAKDAHEAAVTTDCQAIAAERSKERAAPHLRHAAKTLFKVSQALATWRRT